MGLVPIYEFLCRSCGERFEELVSPATSSSDCPSCGESGAERLLSPPAQPMRLVKTPRQRRRLEARRGISRGGAKQRFKEGVRRTRERRPGGQS
jgi:putative FmdB family regulatory protein